MQQVGLPRDTLLLYQTGSEVLWPLTMGAVALPVEIDKILELIRLVSNWMFGLFLTGACLSFVMIFIVPLAVYSRWASLPIMLFTFFTALVTTVASVLATVMVRAFRVL